MLFFYSQDRIVKAERIVTSSFHSLDIPENMISLDRRLLRLWNSGHIAFWWMGASPSLGSNIPIFDGAGPSAVPTQEDYPTLEGDAGNVFSPEALWTVQLQVQFHPHSGANAIRPVQVEDWETDLATQQARSKVTTASGPSPPSERFHGIRLSSGQLLESGHSFTIQVPYGKVDTMKLLTQIQWFCIAGFALAGGAGLDLLNIDNDLADIREWWTNGVVFSQQLDDFSSVLEEDIPECLLPEPRVKVRSRSFVLSELSGGA